MRDYFAASDHKHVEKWMIWVDEGDDDAREVKPLRFKAKSMADAVCKALLEAYLEGYAKGRDAALQMTSRLPPLDEPKDEP